MILINGGRGSGKTTRLIKWSAKTGGWILTSTNETKRFIEYQIKELGLEDKAHVFSRYDLSMKKNIPPYGTKVSIDEFQLLLEDMLPQYQLHELTHSIENKKILRKKNYGTKEK